MSETNYEYYRDPERIAKVLTILGAAWINNNEMRLGQLLINVINAKTCIDIHCLEEGDWVEALMNYPSTSRFTKDELEILEELKNDVVEMTNKL